MTNCTALCHRLMTTYEGTTLLCMTRVTSVIDVIAYQLLLAGRAMGIVAIRANHLTFNDRMV